MCYRPESEEPSSPVKQMWFKRTSKALLGFGSGLGSIMTLIGFPSAVFAVYVFHAELVDLVTEPDVRVELREVTLRCAYTLIYGNELHARYYQNSEPGVHGQICGEAPLGVSFSYRVTNDDTIVRQLKGLRIILDVPGLGEHNYSFAYDIEHVIQDRFDSVTERPWFVRALTPGVTKTYEALLLSEPRESLGGDTPFHLFRDKVEELGTDLAGQKFGFQLWGRFEGTEDIELANCDYGFRETEVLRFTSASIDEQYQITGYC